MSGMSQEAQLASIAATLRAMEHSIGTEFRDLKDGLREDRAKHDREIAELRRLHNDEIARLEKRITDERERIAKWENRGAGILIAVGVFASIIGAVSARVWSLVIGDVS